MIAPRFTEYDEYEWDDKPHTHDPIERPAHYTWGSIEVLDFIEAWSLGFAEGNVIKYVVRAPLKGAALEDLKKARFYLDRLIRRQEGIDGEAKP